MLKLPKDMTYMEKWFLAWMFILIIDSIFIAWVNLTYFESHWVERSGFLKILQPMGMITICAISLYRAFVFRKSKPMTFILGCLFAAFLFFFAFGETLTWGQRILQYPTPEFFHKYNTQDMLTIHNLQFGSFRVNKIVFGLILGIIIAIYGIFGTYLYRPDSWFGKLADRWAIPIARWYHVVALAISFALSKMVMSGKKGEVIQFAGITIFLLIFTNPLNKMAFKQD